jgi:septal ring factor EnvC (AmiA/AmiB activator)
VAFTGLIKCSLCGSTHSFQRRKGKELRITSCQTRIYQEDGSYTVCKNKGVRLDLFEKLFFANFKKYTNKLEQHLEKIKSGIIHDQSFTTEDEKKTLLDSIKKIDVSIKRVQKGFIAEIYTEAEAQKEIKQLKFQKEQIVQQLKRLNSISQDEQINMLQTSINKLKKILDGTTDLEIKEINELLSTHIDFIEYKRVGDHNAEIKMKIHYKR